jgi:hypothetical protein
MHFFKRVLEQVFIICYHPIAHETSRRPIQQALTGRK